MFGVAILLTLPMAISQPVDHLAFGDPGGTPRVWEDLGIGRPISDLIRSGDCRMLIVGDSISNRNTDIQGDENQSSMFWAIVRRWKPENWVGIATPTNGHWPNIQLVRVDRSTASVFNRTLQPNSDPNNIFTYGYRRFATSGTLDVIWDIADMTGGRNIIMNRLMDGDAWSSDPWFEGPLAADFVYLRTPETIDTLRARSRREGEGFTTTPALHPGGEVGVTTIAAPPLGGGAGLPEFALISEEGYDEHARPDHLIWLTTWIRRTDRTGFSLNAATVGGAGVGDFLTDGRLATDERLSEYLAATGNPNLFYIQLGANDGLFPPAWRDDVVELIDRLDRVSDRNNIAPMFLLVANYGTENSISHARALMIAWHLDFIARSGTARVDEDRIAMCSLADMLGGPIDPSWLVDPIHPSRVGAHNLADLIWSQIIRCRADYTGSSKRGDPSFGIPDGVIDGSDFFFYLDLFSRGNEDADLSGAEPGVPDGVIDSSDFFFFLELFASECE